MKHGWGGGRVGIPLWVMTTLAVGCGPAAAQAPVAPESHAHLVAGRDSARRMLAENQPGLAAAQTEQIWRELQHTNEKDPRLAASVYEIWGDSELVQGHYPEARAKYQAALGELEQGRLGQGLDAAYCMLRIAETWVDQFKNDEAVPDLDRSVALIRAQRGAPHPRACGLAQAAYLYDRAERKEQALALANEVWAQLTPGGEMDDRAIFQVYFVMGSTAQAHRDFPRAMTSFQTALAATTRHERRLAAEELEVLASMAAVEHELVHLDPEISIDQRRVALASSLPDRDWKFADIVLDLADRYRDINDDARALELITSYHAVERTLDGVSSQIEERAPPAGAWLPPKDMAPLSKTSVVPPAKLKNAARVVEEMRAGFRACFQAELGRNRNAGGNVRLTLIIDRDGRVRYVRARTLSFERPLVDCLLQRAAQGQFNEPEGGLAVIAVPVTFVKQ